MRGRIALVALTVLLLVNVGYGQSWLRSGWREGLSRVAAKAEEYLGSAEVVEEVHIFEDACDPSSWKWLWNPDCLRRRILEECPIREHWQDNLLPVLQEKLVGQDKAMRMLATALVNKPKGHPLIVHMSGENGSGKSLAALEAARAMYLLTDSSGDPTGMLYIRGSLYAFDPEGIIRLQHRLEYEEKMAEFRAEITTQIVEQLRKCPKALIVFDEYTIPNFEVMTALEQFMEGVPVKIGNSEAVRTVDATFMFISDFGAEGFAQGMSQAEMELQIHADIRESWGDAFYRMQQLMTDVIPFLPMPLPDEDTKVMDITAPDAVVLLLRRLLKAVPETYIYPRHEGTVSISASDDVATNVAHYLYTEAVGSDIYRYRNYRGIVQLFKLRIANELVKEVANFRRKSCPKTTNHIGVTVEQGAQGEFGQFRYSFRCTSATQNTEL